MRRFLQLVLLFGCSCFLVGCEFVQKQPERNVRFIGIGLSYAPFSGSQGVLFESDGQQFRGGALPSCLHDLSLMQQQFSVRGYDSYASTLIDDAAGLVDSYGLCLAALDQVRRQASSSDLTIFYYSGHGNTGDGALVLTDGTFTADGNRVRGKLLELDVLLEKLSAISGDKLVLMDSCYAGNLEAEWEEGNAKWFDRFFSKHGKTRFYILTASAKDELTYCNDEYGYFSNLVATVLQENSSLSFSALYDVVTDVFATMPYSVYQMHPASNTSIPLDLII